MISVPCKYCPANISVDGISYACPQCSSIHIIGGSSFDLVACWVLFSSGGDSHWAYVSFERNEIRIEDFTIQLLLKCRCAIELSLEDIRRKIATHLVFS